MEFIQSAAAGGVEGLDTNGTDVISSGRLSFRALL
jgi:hypothetical protein